MDATENQPLVPLLQRSSTQKPKRVSFLADVESQYYTFGDAKKQVSRRDLNVQKKIEVEKKTTTVKRRKSRQDHTPEFQMLRRHSYRLPARIYRIALRTLVFVSTVNFVLETEQYFQHCCTPYFNIFEGIISTLFLMEYCLKIRTVPQRKLYKYNENFGSLGARLSFIFSGESFIDLMSCLPFFVEMAAGINPAKYELVRMLRLFRLFKLPVLWDALRMVARVVYYNFEILGSAFFVCFIMLLVCSVLLFYTKPPLEMDHYDNFSSVLACMYLAILLLTGQGTPDGQLPWYTRVVVAFTALFAIAQFAIPASMLTWGFEQEAEQNIVKNDKRENKVIEHFIGGHGDDICMSSSSSDESDRNEEWEGHLRNVTGKEESSDSEENDDDVDIDDDGKGTKRYATRFLSIHERRRARMIFRRLAGGDDEKHIGRDIIDQLASINRKELSFPEAANSSKNELSVDEAGKNLFDNMCKRFGDDNEIVDDDESKKNNSISLLQFYRWLGYVKTSFPRYGQSIFLRILRNLDDLSEQIEDKNDEANKNKETQEVDGARTSVVSVQKPKASGDCLPCARKLTYRRSSSKPQHLCGAFGMSSGQLSKGLEKQTQQLERENAALQKEIEKMEKEIAALKKEN